MQDLFGTNLKERRKYLEKLISKKKNALIDVPEGRVRCKSKNGKPEYYWVTAPGDTTGRYLASEKTELAAKLAQKAYDTSVLTAASAECKLIRKLEQCREKHDPGRIYEDYGELRKELVTPISEPDEEYIEKWLSRKYQKLGFEEGAPKILSKNGLCVRSKSELIIVEMLDSLNVPFLYECPVVLKGWGTVYPDFTVLNVRLRKVFFWEHLGKMDDPDYVNRNLGKINAYQRNGYYPGDSLILTFETKDCPISSRDVENTVRHYLL